ncbi:MFS transporter [Nonomuraea guangzhouensis]|uniref:MFS transporter n=1 Tax=Nonomuraea guangzhouensis TaxID=1291555 RepID=A0ABW4GB19_9ACTN|nr:MFS transporter [Nonomuraea guangzhouensis]
MITSSPWRTPDFRILFTATALSHLATNIGYVAIPLIAVTALHAGPGQAGALAALSTAAFLLIGLPAGAWVDRMRHRRVLILADLARAGLLASIPIAWWLDALTFGQLYAVVLLTGCATVFFDVGSQSVLPQLVGRDGLVQANAAVMTLIAAGNVAGRGAGGGLVQLLTAPVAVACAAAGYLASALRLGAIRGTAGVPAAERPARLGAMRGTAGASAAERSTRLGAIRRTAGAPAAEPPARLGAQIAEGLRHVLGNAELRALALTGTLTNLGSQIVNTVLPILFVSELGLPPGALGLFWAAGGAGLLLGARCARPIAARLGHGRTLGLAGPLLAPAGLLIPLIDRGPGLWLAGAGWLLAMTKTGMDNVLGVSLRQGMTPDGLLGRMNATFRFLLTGALAIGAAVAGLIGELTTVRVTLWVGAVFLAIAFLPVFLSPLRARRELPAGIPAASS